MSTPAHKSDLQVDITFTDAEIHKMLNAVEQYTDEEVVEILKMVEEIERRKFIEGCQRDLSSASTCRVTTSWVPTTGTSPTS